MTVSPMVIAGVTVFLDSDNDGTCDAGETAATTDADGRFLLLAEPGTYTVRAQLSDGTYRRASDLGIV